MSDRAGNQPQDEFDNNIVANEIGMGMNQGRLAYSYSNRVVTALDQELKEWQARSAHLEIQLGIARQDNLNLHRQLEERKKGTITHCTIEKISSPQVEIGEPSRKRLNEQGQGKAATKKTKLIRCRYCRRANHLEKDCWRKARKCLKCGSTEHQIRDCPQKKENAGQLSQGNPPTQCRYCGKSNHRKSECWKKIGKCLRCGSSKHKIKECTGMKENPRTEP